MIKMTGKEMKAYAKRAGLKLKSGAVAALLSSSGSRVSSPIKTISGIPDDAKGWFDPSINRFDASTPKTTLKVTFVGSPEPDERKREVVRKAEKREEPTYSYGSGCSGGSAFKSGC